MAKEFIYKKTKELGKLSDTTTVEVGHYTVDGKEMPDKIYLVNHFTRKNGFQFSRSNTGHEIWERKQSLSIPVHDKEICGGIAKRLSKEYNLKD